jgi:hypothetical protein
MTGAKENTVEQKHALAEALSKPNRIQKSRQVLEITGLETKA